MLPILNGILFAVGFLIACLIFDPPRVGGIHKGNKIQRSIFALSNLDKIQGQAEAVGWKISKREAGIMVGAGLALVVVLTILTNNPLILLTGIIVSSVIPKFIIEKKRRSMRINLMTKLTDPLRMLLSRLPDQQNLTRAIEATRDETTDEQIRAIFDGYLNEVALGGGVLDALDNLKRRVRLRKFDSVVETLAQAHSEGFTAEAMNALDKATEAIEFDLRAIEKVRMVSSKKKRQLYAGLAVAWGFIPILSMMRSTDSNIYLDAIPGKVLILLYTIGTLYIIIKGEEYLSLNLDEL